MAAKDEKVTVEVEHHRLQLTNLGKVLYPAAGFTKGEVIDYYSRIAPVLLPHVVDRPMTVKRYPNGVDEKFFFEKNAARGTPDWVRTVNLPVPGSTKNRETIDYVVNGKPALDWVVERQCVKTDKASGIVNDANDWAIETIGNPKYPLELFQRVITVSLETLQIVRSLPALEL